MASKNDVDKVVELFKKSRKNHFLHTFNDLNKGIFAVLKFLSENENSATCGEISTFLGVSTARIAVILKRLLEKGYVTKETSESDARITIVSLTDVGKSVLDAKDNEIRGKIAVAIDTVGIDKIIEVSHIINKINHIMKSDNKIIKGDKSDDKDINEFN